MHYRLSIILAAALLTAAVGPAQASPSADDRPAVSLPQDDVKADHSLPEEPTKGIGAMFLGMAFLLRRKRR